MIVTTTFKKEEKDIKTKDRSDYKIWNFIYGDSLGNEIGVNATLFVENNVYEIVQIDIFSEDCNDTEKPWLLRKYECESIDDFNKLLRGVMSLWHISPFKHDVEKFPPKLI